MGPSQGSNPRPFVVSVVTALIYYCHGDIIGDGVIRDVRDCPATSGRAVCTRLVPRLLITIVIAWPWTCLGPKVGRWFPPGTPVSSTRKLISSSFHRLDMTLAVAEALNPNKPNQNRPTQPRLCIQKSLSWCIVTLSIHTLFFQAYRFGIKVRCK